MLYTLQKSVLETRLTLIRRREAREDIMLMLQRMMNLPQREPNKKVMILQVMKNKVLISTLMGTITHGSNDWLIDSGASKHMMGFKESFVKLLEMNHPTR